MPFNDITVDIELDDVMLLIDVDHSSPPVEIVVGSYDLIDDTNRGTLQDLLSPSEILAFTDGVSTISANRTYEGSTDTAILIEDSDFFNFGTKLQALGLLKLGQRLRVVLTCETFGVLNTDDEVLETWQSSDFTFALAAIADNEIQITIGTGVNRVLPDGDIVNSASTVIGTYIVGQDAQAPDIEVQNFDSSPAYTQPAGTVVILPESELPLTVPYVPNPTSGAASEILETGDTIIPVTVQKGLKDSGGVDIVSETSVLKKLGESEDARQVAPDGQVDTQLKDSAGDVIGAVVSKVVKSNDLESQDITAPDGLIAFKLKDTDGDILYAGSVSVKSNGSESGIIIAPDSTINIQKQDSTPSDIGAVIPVTAKSNETKAVNVPVADATLNIQRKDTAGTNIGAVIPVSVKAEATQAQDVEAPDGTLRDSDNVDVLAPSGAITAIADTSAVHSDLSGQVYDVPKFSNVTLPKISLTVGATTHDYETSDFTFSSSPNKLTKVIDDIAGGPTKMGVYFAPLVNNLTWPSYQTYDETWYRSNGHYQVTVPPDPIIIARPNQATNNGFTLIDGLNRFGNDARFTRTDGTPLVANEAYVSNQSFLDHLHGKEYRFKLGGGDLLWHGSNCLTYGSTWRVANTMEMFSIMVEQNGLNPFAHVSRVVSPNRPRIITCTVIGNNSNSIYCAGSSSSSLKALFSTARTATNDALYVRDFTYLTYIP
jgi:hypothetical protein